LTVPLSADKYEINEITKDINQTAFPKQFFDSYGLIVCTYEKFPKILYINKRMLDFLNVTDSNQDWLEFVKDNIYFMIPYEESAYFRKDFENADQTGEPQRVSHVVLCSDNNKIELNGWLNVSENEYGQKQFTIVYTKRADNINALRNIKSNPYLYALSYSYNLIFAFRLLSDTVECIHGQTTSTIGSIYDASMTIESAKNFWINNYICEDDREQMRFFLDELTAPGEWDTNFIPKNDFRVKWKDGDTYKYTGVAVKMDPFLVLLCCKRKTNDSRLHTQVMEEIALSKLNDMTDFFFFRESDAIGMLLLEKYEDDFTLTYANKRICTYLGISRKDYLHLVSGNFPLRKILESSGVTREQFNELIEKKEVLSHLYGRDYVAEKDIRLTCDIAEYEGRTLYCILVYETTTAAPSAPVIPSNGIFVRTFGHFDVFVDGVPVKFSSSKEKELLALLIDRNGGTLSSHDAISYLWEDEAIDDKISNRYRKLAMNLKNTLSDYGIEHIVINNHGVRNIDVNAITCDYYEMLRGNEQYRKTFHNVYMSDYSWAEDTLATLWEYS
jgi:hypothetical protein